ncbi:hypothetical protein BpHYR1_006986 [Brachionus plicatilis]|uniref:Uncharacterized protein n=1 Tax=Brachionus plicatilis TaxID=10195 RepID=A0A3M7QEW4_BRAPC|nr:hypothetical protein BpHYR1_006986 [Brachionus plicatilis]
MILLIKHNKNQVLIKSGSRFSSKRGPLSHGLIKEKGQLEHHSLVRKLDYKSISLLFYQKKIL